MLRGYFGFLVRVLDHSLRASCEPAPGVAFNPNKLTMSDYTYPLGTRPIS